MMMNARASTAYNTQRCDEGNNWETSFALRGDVCDNERKAFWTVDVESFEPPCWSACATYLANTVVYRKTLVVPPFRLSQVAKIGLQGTAKGIMIIGLCSV